MDILLLLAGPLFIAVTFALMALRVEPFANFFYLCAWYGLIFTFDQLIRRREGRSLIGRCGPGFLLVLIWSAAAWYFFELVNLRLQNWYYVFVVDQPLVRPIGTFLSFATVFPGIFWIDHYLGLRGVGADIRGKPLRFAARGRRNLQGVGLLFLALPMVWPSYFFPLVWGTVFLLLAPLDQRCGKGGLLHQLEEGNYGPLVRTLLAGLIAGFFWESLNFWARAKWIYTVPFFDRLKLFEMPVAGFLGFPPFAVECAMLYRLLVWRGWAPRFGAFTEGPPEAGGAVGKGVAVLAALVFCAGVDYYVVGPTTITSVTPRADLVEGLDRETKEVLRERGIRYLTDLEGWEVWEELDGALDEEQREALRRVSSLYLHQGIGVRYGNRLAEVGIGSLKELGALTAEQVRRRLEEAGNAESLPTLPQIRVWVRRASKEE